MYGPNQALDRIAADYSADRTPAGGRVELRFHTYHGFVLARTVTEHRHSLHPGRAREMLWRLHKFNLTWGLLAAGFLFVPFLSYANYLVQKRRIARQERAMADYEVVGLASGDGWEEVDDSRLASGPDWEEVDGSDRVGPLKAIGAAVLFLLLAVGIGAKVAEGWKAGGLGGAAKNAIILAVGLAGYIVIHRAVGRAFSGGRG